MRPASHIAGSMVNGTHCTLVRRGEVPVLSQIFLMDERSPRGQIILFCQ
jgi:hypothetical protein